VHELSLCQAIAGAAADHAGGRRVVVVRLRIGHFRQVVPETLTYCWELHVQGTSLDGCRLDVDYIPATIACSTCRSTTTLEMPVLMCGTCGGRQVELITGEEFMIESIDVADTTEEVR
jgi:hydrogenase nickel incorporation protein HypA/HybF